jgi:nucleoside-diphosphate-sugar epimerase
MGRTILVTGAGGFIGSAVARRLVGWIEAGGAAFWDGEPAESICALLSPRSSAVRLETIAQSPALVIERANIITTEDLRLTLRRYRPKVVLHLAFDASGFQPQTEEQWQAIHFSPMKTIFEELSQTEGVRFVHTSSAWVLAPGEHLAEDATVAPMLDYAKTKAKLDEALAPLHCAYGVPFINLRPFNVFGRYENIRRLMPHLVDCFRQGTPARLSHGDQVRDFNDVDDIAEAYRLALLSPTSACGALYHIGSGRGVCVREFAAMVRAAMAAPGVIELNAAQTRDRNISSLVCDPALAMRELGWRPNTNLESRIREVADWWLARSVQTQGEMCDGA